ncbi:selenoprotein M [Bombyx mori]|uniref:Selenoprotein M n=1 Tax=Bombyx mori TaxID=7091 RepID=A0A8R2G9G1_BOMMO|nr:selenoprotein M [Bombyx mori]
MKITLLSVVIFCAVVALSSEYELSDIVSARIESCRGCSLNRLPEVKRFVMDDAPNYDRVEVKFISGAPPELVLLGEGDHELERLPLSHLNQEQCNELIQSKGFSNNKKSDL